MTKGDFPYILPYSYCLILRDLGSISMVEIALILNNYMKQGIKPKGFNKQQKKFFKTILKPLIDEQNEWRATYL